MSTESESRSQKTLSPAQQLLQRYLDKPFRVELTDGRVVVGYLVCTDNAPNVILKYAEEFWLSQGKDGFLRPLGTIIIPSRAIKSIRILKENTST